ncbi:Sua5/YciO/YrdC/YwlC family protein [Thauera sp. 28]|uniref:L-threonylcarbamoyladenylate synthase n=1 Tax=Thauera sp. 28 TaxID=303682 RepID=UPI0002CD911D|nr:L-threonylcarbamoyladenylate synthase [Thauera sp. 28]ENO93597.1 Sua5/YciO/YrdC/YwlC family protein [Thauera sp. 28]
MTTSGAGPRGRIESATAASIAEAVALLRAGDIVGMPTETVYGLAADALDVQAVGRIFAAKGRPADHPLIVHLPSADHLPQWAAAIPKDALALARAFWPGPLTLILKRSPDVPDEVTGGQGTVGLRVPSHPVALALLRAFDGGLAAPSANRFGRISPTTAAHVREELGERVAMILDGGACEVGIESTILDFSRDVPEILRPGAIGPEDIARVIGRRPRVRGEALPEADETAAGHERAGAVAVVGNDVVAPASADAAKPAPRVSGALAAHYAPRTPLRLVEPALLADEAAALAGEGSRVAVLAHSTLDPRDARLTWRSLPVEPAAYAQGLYASLRALDAVGADFILIEALPGGPGWRAVADRLGRAAVGSGGAET